MPSLNFDRIAERYDETRGGEERGDRVVGPLSELLDRDRPALEVGVGTGLISLALARRGFRMLGLDISSRMLSYARRRLGPRVVQGDALRLPIRDASLDQVIAVWALHVIGDIDGALAEIGRVLRPGGRLLVVNSPTEPPGGMYAEYFLKLERALDPNGLRDDSADRLRTAAPAAGLILTAVERIQAVATETVAAMIEHLRTRSYSMLWDVDDAAWARHVEPLIERLESLPAEERDVPNPVDVQVVVLKRQS